MTSNILHESGQLFDWGHPKVGWENLPLERSAWTIPLGGQRKRPSMQGDGVKAFTGGAFW